MFNSYNDAHLMNESYVFYATSINTFKNPAFAALECDNDQGQGQNCYGLGKQKTMAASGHQQCLQPGDPSTTTKQKLIDFCDNFAFNLRAKLFIMETNFKRQLRGFRRFLNQRVVPRRWLRAKPTLAREINPRSLANQEQQIISAKAGDLRDLLATGQNLATPAELDGSEASRLRPSELISAKSLVCQQERILTRLERIKRDSQRLFNMQHATCIMDANNKLAQEREREILSLDRVEYQSGRFQVPAWFGKTKIVGHKWAAPGSRSHKQDSRHLSSRVGRARCPAITRGNMQLRQVAATAAAAYSLANPKKTCIVCYERAPNIVTLPCEHSDICSDCFIEIIYMAVKNSQYPLRCVLCRQKVERIRCSRRLMLSVIKRNRRSSGYN